MSALELEDAKTYLRITGNTSDAELQATIDAAEAAIAARIGGLATSETTARIGGGSFVLVLPVMPVADVTSVISSLGTVIDLDDLNIDTASGLITFNSGAAFNEATYDVVYDAGRETVPADLMLAIKELVRHLWATQRGAGVPTGSPNSEALSNTIPGSAWTFPFRVEQLLAPHVTPGIV